MSDKLKVLVIGSGGREHAIAWKISKSPRVSELICAPGNAGIARIGRCVNADAGDIEALAGLAKSIGADLTVVGPEAPLVLGVVERFQSLGLRIVGPSAAAARLEGSKVFAKQFMSRHRIPTARFAVCESAAEARDNFKREFSLPVVVKADGLAAGKGVRIATTQAEFDEAVEAMMVDRVFGEAGTRILLEECLVGREASLMLFTDGRDYKTIVPAQDYKRVYDGDRGPNTGGMGTFSTPGLIDAQMLARICLEAVEPTLKGMASEGHPFSGILYLGLMLTEAGPQVIEYNCRLGDPETQSVLMRLNSEFIDICEAIVDHRLGSCAIEWSDDSAVCVVMASGGYPGTFQKGRPINGVEAASSLEGVVVFHAGASRDEAGNLVTSGGRVLGVTARSATLNGARSRAYEAVDKISFEGMHYRKDIAK